MALDRDIRWNCLMKWCFMLSKTALDSQCYSTMTCDRLSGSVSLNVCNNRTLKLLCKLITYVEGFFSKNVLGRSQRVLSYHGFCHRDRWGFCTCTHQAKRAFWLFAIIRSLTVLTTQWLIYVPPLLTLTNSVFVRFRMMLAINSDHFPKHNKSWCL